MQHLSYHTLCYRYGLNIKTLNDSQCAYTFRSDVYCGEPRVITANSYYLPSTLGVTSRLMEQYGWNKLRGNHLTTDNYYSSVALANVCAEHNLTFCGTIRGNRKGVDQEFLKIQGREVNSTVVWYEKFSGKLTLSSYCVSTKSKGKKCVLLLSNLPDIPHMGVTRDDGKKKSALFKLYDFSMGVTDVCGNYNCIQLYFFKVSKVFHVFFFIFSLLCKTGSSKI